MGLRMKCSYGFFTSSAEPKEEKPACSSATEAISDSPPPAKSLRHLSLHNLFNRHVNHNIQSCARLGPKRRSLAATPACRHHPCHQRQR